MTRLKADWLESLERELAEYDQKLKNVTGMDLAALAFCAAGWPEGSKDAAKNRKVAVIRMTAGQGVIGYFAESVAAVAKHMQMDVFIADECDVAGIHEALSRGAEILMMADEERFIAFNARTSAVGENDEATVRGYAAGLSAMAGGLSGRSVLLLGYGRIGQAALIRLLEEGASVSVYDCDEQKINALREKISGTALPDKGRVNILSKRPGPLSGLVFDATSQGAYLGAKDLQGDVLIAAPGVPLSLNEEAYALHDSLKQIMHDPLQTGTAVMLAMALKSAAN